MYKVVLEYEDGRAAVLERHVPNLTEAISFALELADRVGKYKGDGHGPPRFVNICSGEHVEIAISVIAGGLVTREDAPQSPPS